MSIIFWYGVNHLHGQSTLLQATLTKRRNFTRFHSSASKPPVKVSVSSWIQFLFQIEDDLDKTTIDRMNEYGSVDAVKESFDLLQQRVSEAFTCYWHSTSTNEVISSVDFQRWKRLEYLTNPRVSFTSKENQPPVCTSRAVRWKCSQSFRPWDRLPWASLALWFSQQETGRKSERCLPLGNAKQIPFLRLRSSKRGFTSTLERVCNNQTNIVCFWQVSL